MATCPKCGKKGIKVLANHYPDYCPKAQGAAPAFSPAAKDTVELWTGSPKLIALAPGGKQLQSACSRGKDTPMSRELRRSAEGLGQTTVYRGVQDAQARQYERLKDGEEVEARLTPISGFSKNRQIARDFADTGRDGRKVVLETTVREDDVMFDVNAVLGPDHPRAHEEELGVCSPTGRRRVRRTS